MKIIKSLKIWAIVMLVAGQGYGQSESCYEVLGNYSGFQNLHPPHFVDSVCTIMQNMNNLIVEGKVSTNRNNQGFKVYTRPHYVLLTNYVENAYMQQREELFNMAATLSEYHIVVSKEFYTTGTVHYAVQIKLPNTGIFSNLTELDKAAMALEIGQIMTNTYIITKTSYLAEWAGFEKFREYIRQLTDGVYSLDSFEKLDFISFYYNSDQEIIRWNNTKNITNNVINFGGISFINNDIAESANEIFELYSTDLEYGINYKFIITSKADGQALNEAMAEFNKNYSENTIIIWLHFDFHISSPPALKGNNDNDKRNSSERVMMVKTKNTLTEAKLGEIADGEFDKIRNAKPTVADCSFPQKDFGTRCIIPKGTEWFGDSPMAQFGIGVSAGLMDALMETVYLIFETGKSWWDKIKDFDRWLFQKSVDATIFFVESFRNFEVFKTKVKETAKQFVKSMDDLNEILTTLYDTINSLSFNLLKELAIETFNAIKETLQGILQGDNLSLAVGLAVGYVAFEILTAILTGGSGTIAKTAVKGSKIGKGFLEFIKSFKNPTQYKSKLRSQLESNPKFRIRSKICIDGCFVRNTPVLMAYNPLKIADIKPIAFAAAMPLMAVPIQDVQLLDYAAAHKTVNAGYGMVAQVGDDVYTGLMDKDPYTSDQQRLRDRYKLDDENWHEVVFEELNGSSIAKLALHQDWMHQHSYSVDAIVNMNLPEQGISGPFRITSIKHILPQKVPECDDIASDYDFRPVTGLFIHQSNQVIKLAFDQGDTLGVTASHPIFSTTYNTWRLAGDLEIDEKVLTFTGEATVRSVAADATLQEVYNLEVKDLHNFLVGDVGVVVHNGCIPELFNLHKSLFKNLDDVIHILRGNIKNGKAGGVHHISAIEFGTARIVPGTKISGPNGLYMAKVEVKNTGESFIAKTSNGGYSTFFPDSWDQIKVLDEISHTVKSNGRRNLISGNEYWGYATDGKIKIHYYLT